MTTPTINSTFTLGSTEYIINEIAPVDPALKRTIERLESTGKDTVHYHASKVLKSGKKSKQGGVFLRYKTTGEFIKL